MKYCLPRLGFTQRAARALGACVPGLIALLVATPTVAAQPAGITAERWTEFTTPRAKTVLELQPLREATTVSTPAGPVTLLNLHPGANSWLLLNVGDGGGTRVHHLENTAPARQRIALAADFHDGVVIVSGDRVTPCALWHLGGEASPLVMAARAPGAYAPLCDGALSLRRTTKGHRTQIERLTELLRDNVWKGEQIITTARELLLQDRGLERGSIAAGTGSNTATALLPSGTPAPAAVGPEFGNAAIAHDNLRVKLAAGTGTRMAAGQWYPAAAHDSIHVSLVEPRAIAETGRPGATRIGALDATERGALTYLLAFDLARLDVTFAMGTDHPRLGWSDRTVAQSRNDKLPGPDGIDSAQPLVMTGIVPPWQRTRVAATFIGGFKRGHAAFKFGPMALKNSGSHYGVIEQGVVLSKPQPGLATFIVHTDGSVAMKTWAERDLDALGRIRHLRQNGVALVEPGADGTPAAGALVGQWGPGNWSGSHDRKLRTMRAGLCLQSGTSGQFLLYGVFTSATPVAMARVFLGYGCSYAMLLDMNAYEHTYAALYPPDGSVRPAQHLIHGMHEADRVTNGEAQARFVDYPDNRDFFYLTPRR